MKKALYLAIMLISAWATAQTTGVGTVTPSPSAQLEVSATNKGLLMPRVALTSSTDATTITTGNVESLMVYNTATVADITPGYYYWDGAKWTRVADTGSIPMEPWYGVDDDGPATDNTEDMYVMGNVGIGTNTPAYDIDVYNNTDARLNLEGGASSIIYLKDGDATLDTNGHQASIRFVDQNNTETGFMGFGTNGQIFGIANRNTANGSVSIRVGTTGAYGILIDSINNVGINTPAPTERLDVANGNLRLRSYPSTRNDTAAAPVNNLLYTDTNGVVQSAPAAAVASLTEPWYSTATGTGATANTDSVYIMGNVGVGTTTPATELQVVGTVRSTGNQVFGKTLLDYPSFDPAAGWIAGRTNSPAALHFSDASTTVGNLIGQTYKTNSVTWNNDRLTGFFGLEKTNATGVADFVWYLASGNFSQQPVERMRIKSNGNVGIGTIDPTAKLEINAGTANTSGLKFTQLNASTPVSSGATLGVDAAGNVVTVPGSAFSATSATVTAGGGSPTSVSFADGDDGTPKPIVNFTISDSGTYLINYNIRVQANGSVPAGGYLVAQIIESPSGPQVPNSNILVVQGPNNGLTSSGSVTLTVTAPTNYVLRASCANLNGSTGTIVVIDNAQGASRVTYTKIAP